MCMYYKKVKGMIDESNKYVSCTRLFEIVIRYTCFEKKEVALILVSEMFQ